MPAALTHPGVYIEEIPSGVRTITGVATSITAFIGRARRGSVNEPVAIASFGDFERRFGGLHVDDPMSYAVRDFYLNGGGPAIVVRLHRPPAAGDGVARKTVSGLKLDAASPGSWANGLKVTIDTTGITDDVAARFGVAKSALFNLTLSEGDEGPTERHANVTVAESSRRVDRVLEQESLLARIKPKADGSPDLPSSAPAAATDTLADGSDGRPLTNSELTGSETNKTGLYALKKADLFNLLCMPPDTRDGDTAAAVYQEAVEFCKDRRAILIVDPPNAWGKVKETAASEAAGKLTDLGLSGTAARNAALYFPRTKAADPLREGQPDVFVPCGAVAGMIARTDTERGVWKAPAGLDAALNGLIGLQAELSDEDSGKLNPLGINALRTFPLAGRVVWGGRTLRGADQLADEYKYLPVRRLALYIEESLYRGTQWVVFEPNDEPLWAQIRLNVGAFMQGLFRQGAFAGTTPREAYFVKCDKESTTQDDVNRGVVNVLVGFAPLKPAEFVVIKLQQLAGQIES